MKFFKPLYPRCVCFLPSPLPPPGLRWSDLQGVRTVCHTIALSSGLSTCVRRPSLRIKPNKHSKASCLLIFPHQKQMWRLRCRGGKRWHRIPNGKTDFSLQCFVSPPSSLPAHPYSWISQDHVQPTCGVSFQRYMLQTAPLNPPPDRRNVWWISQRGEFGLRQICIRYQSGCCSCSYSNESLRLWVSRWNWSPEWINVKIMSRVAMLNCHLSLSVITPRLTLV